MGAAWSLSFTGKDLNEAVLKAFAFWRDNQDWLGLTVDAFFAGCRANAARTRIIYREAVAFPSAQWKVARAARGRLAKPRLAMGHTGSIPVPSATPPAPAPQEP